MEDSKNGQTKNTLITLSTSELNAKYSKEEIRKLFPKVTKHLDKFREHFPSAQCTYLWEDFIEVKDDDD